MTLPRRRWRVAGASLVATAVILTGLPAPGHAEPTPGGGSATKTHALRAGHGSGMDGLILRQGGATAVKDSYIVVLKDEFVSPASVGRYASRMARQFGGQVVRTYRHALRGYEITMSAAEARRLAAHPAVAYVEQNHTVHISDTQSPVPSWGLDRIDQRTLSLDNSYTYPTTAAGVTVYIIDTGIRFSHNTFGGRAVSGFDAIDGGSADDGHGHGTHVAGTVGGSQYGVAKGVTLVGVRVLNNSGSGTNAQVIAGIDWVTGDHDPGEPAVANMSLGGSGSALNSAVANSIADGVSYAVAAGNSGANACSFTPASTPEAITVGATGGTSGSSDARPSFSNYGACLDIFAPGVAITSSWNTSDTATNTISGTSMASPHVAGAAALVLAQNPSFTPQQVRDFLVDNATTGVVTNPGSGSPNLLLFVVNGPPPPPGDDFSVAVSPTSRTVTQGDSTTTTVSTATVSGDPQTVTFSATGLPTGTTASFAPGSVTSGGSSTLTLSTSGSTPTGTFTITVRGTAASGTKSVPFTLLVTGSGGCSSPGQKLGNPGFESGWTIWEATPDVIDQWDPYQPPRSGTWNAWLVGYGFSTYDILQQPSITLPADCSSYQLTFWLHVDTAETTTSVEYDQLGVQVISGGSTTTLEVWSNLDAAPGYSQQTVDLSAFAGETITLRFLAIEDFFLYTSFVIDDTALTVA
jgi:subtilisin family serine protease